MPGSIWLVKYIVIKVGMILKQSAIFIDDQCFREYSTNLWIFIHKNHLLFELLRFPYIIGVLDGYIFSIHPLCKRSLNVASALVGIISEGPNPWVRIVVDDFPGSINGRVIPYDELKV